MSKFKKGLMKRVMAIILSGAMVMSNMTAFASEAPADTGGYIEEVVDEVSENDDADSKSADEEEVKDDAEVESATEGAVTEETTKSEDNATNGTDDADDNKETTVEIVETAETEDEEQTSETESSLSVETEEDAEEKETDTKEDDVRAEATAYTTPTKKGENGDWSSNWSNYYVFGGSVFGLTQNFNAGEYAVKEDTDHTMFLSDTANRTKLEDLGSGRAMYFYQLGSDEAFTLKARATVKVIKANDGQSAFGLMARDDMVIDTKAVEFKNPGSGEEIPSDRAECVKEPGRGTNYVVAGTDGKNKPNCYKRDISLYDNTQQTASTLLRNSNKIASVPVAGDVYDLSISFDGSKYTCQFGNNTPVVYETNDTFNLKKMDPNYQYIGMFVARGTSITFDRIYLEKGSGANKEVIMDQRSNVSGTITGISGTANDLKVIFTDQDKKETEVDVTKEGDTYKYETQLYAGEYSVRLSDTSYTISSGSTLTVENKAAKELDANSHPIAVQGVARVTVSGSLDIPEDAKLDDLELTFSMDGDEVPVTITGTSYTAELAADSTYKLIAKATYMDDYTYDVKSITVGSTPITNKVIKFTKKPMYDIEIDVTSFDNKNIDVSGSKIIFTEIKDETEENAKTVAHDFIIGTDKIQLKNGEYSVSANIDVKYPYYLVYPNLVVEGANKKYTLNFDERLAWDFTIADPVLTDSVKEGYKNPDDPKGDQEYQGLYVNTASGKFQVRVAENRVQVNEKTQVKIPVSGRGTVAIEPADGSYTLKKLTDKDQNASDLANQNDNGTITYNENTKYVLMEATNLVWLTKITVTRDPAVEVSGNILNPDNADLSNCTISFVNQTDNIAIPVKVESDGSYAVKLTSGYTYVATLSGNAQYGFADTNRTIEVKNADIPNVDLTVVSKDTIKYTGNITGFAADYARKDNLKIVMVAGVDKVDVTIDKTDMSFEAILESGIEYTIQLEGVDDYSLKSEATIKLTSSDTKDIVVEPKTTYTVSGNLLELDDGTEVTKLSFTRLNDEGALDRDYVYEATIDNKNKTYSVKLRDGKYEASAEVAGYQTKTHVEVSGGVVKQDLFFIYTDTSALEWKADLYVGYNDREDSYKTITRALNAAKRMKPTSEAKRITIHIYPGLYREQITVDVPYVTFKNDFPSEEVTLTWYYGVGYKYYSSNPAIGLGVDGFYDPEYAFNKKEKNTVFRWGCTVRVKATDFKAENIIFENSFNRYLTEEEIADGVEPIEQKEKKPERNKNLDVTSKAAGERAAALYIEDQGDRAEFYNCQFLSNQDTIGTGSTSPHSYFRDCLIEGNTDYICGAGDAVFENCELKFAGYSDESSGGYITAASLPLQYGYLFLNCKVTGKHNEGAIKDIGYLGRPWFSVKLGEDEKPIPNQKRATVTFVNTVLDRADIITPVGWNKMSGTKPEDAIYKEYNTTLKDGTPADTSKRTANTVVTKNPVDDVKVYFGSWRPAHYVDAPASDEKRNEVPMGTEIHLTSATTDAKIYYTTDGKEPTSASTLYADSISLGNEEKTVTIKAIAIKEDLKSSVSTFEYTVVDPDKFVAAPEATPEAGKVNKGTKVTLTCETEGADIYYTTDGSAPTAESQLYGDDTEIVINETTTVKAIAIKGGNKSAVAKFEYTVESTSVDPVTVAPPTSSIETGTTVPVGTEIILRAEEGATIYYTEGEADPTENSEEYKAPIELGNEAKKITIKAIAVKDGVKSKVATFEYTVSTELDPDKFVAPPTSDTPEGEVEKGTKVTLSAEEGAKIYYTLDGPDPTAESTEYTGPIDLGNEAKKIVIKAIAIKGENVSEISTFEYTVKGDSSSEDKEQVKAPEASPAAGAVAAGTKVTLKSATEDAKIYYTLGEADPTVESKLYTDAEPITITEAVTIKAFAVKEGMKDSGVVTFAYTISNTPVVPVEPDDPGDDKKDIWITGLEAQYYYTGAKITPDIKVWDCDIKGNDRLLVPGIDYAVSYKNNSKVSTATVKAEVIITGKGNYEGKGVTEKFEIVQASSVQNPINVKGAKVELVDKKYAPEYDGTPKTPDFKLVIKGKPEVVYTYNNGSYVRKDGEPMDVNVAVSNNINKGSATILVTGEVVKGKATSAKAAFKIMPVDLSKATVNVKAESAMYAVKGAIPEVTVTCNGMTLVNGRDYVAKFGNNKKAKVKGTVTIAGKGNYTKNAKPVTFDIDQLDMSGLSVSAATVYEKAKAGKIKATVLDQDGNELKPAQYTLKVYKADGTTEYGVKDELKAGDKIFIQAVAKDANLTGSTPKNEFKVGKDISKAKFKLKKSVKKSYTGSEVKLVATDFEPVTLKGVTGTLEMGRDFEVIAYSNNINKGNATAVIRGIGDYSGTKTIKFKITQKTMIKGSGTASN